MARALPGLERWPVFHELMRLRCVAGVMQNIEDITENEQFKSRQFLAETHVEGAHCTDSGRPGQADAITLVHQTTSASTG